MKKVLFFCGMAALVIGCSSKTEEETPAANSSTTASTSGEGTATADISFAANIQPVMNDKCIKCHGENGKEGVDLRTYESVMKGGKDGPIVKEGDPDHSTLVHVLYGRENHPQMPPKSDPLPKETIEAVEAWIKGGAKA